MTVLTFYKQSEDCNSRSLFSVNTVSIFLYDLDSVETGYLTD